MSNERKGYFSSCRFYVYTDIAFLIKIAKKREIWEKGCSSFSKFETTSLGFC